MRAIAAAAALLLTAAWLRFGVAIAGGLVERSGASGPGAEGLFTLLVFAPILLLAVAVGRITRTAALAAGREPLGSGATGAAAGFAGLALATGYLALAGTLRPGVPVSPLWVLPGVLVIGFQVLAEEALFRGLLQPALVRAVGVPGGVALTAAAFAAMHLLAGALDAVVLLNLFLGGVLFGSLALRRRGIAAAVGGHWAWNAGEQLLFGLDPNPGIGSFGAIWNLDAVGTARWGGSEQGLNASWAMTIALAAVTLPLVLPRLRPRRAVAVDHVAPRAKTR